jgi:hypothetical protein
MEFRQSVVPDLPRHELLGDDSLRLAARPQHGVREQPHQTHIPAAVHQLDVAPCQFRSKLLGGGAVLRNPEPSAQKEPESVAHSIAG